MQWLPTVDARKQLMAMNIKKKVFEGLYKGFLATFDSDPNEDPNNMADNTCSMAERFAKEASVDIANGIVDEIDTYLKGLVINVPAAPQASLACAVGPVSGTVLIPDTMITVG